MVAKGNTVGARRKPKARPKKVTTEFVEQPDNVFKGRFDRGERYACFATGWPVVGHEVEIGWAEEYPNALSICDDASRNANCTGTRIVDRAFKDPDKPSKEMVNHPDHYGGDTTYEVIKVLKAWLTPEEFLGFLKGNAIKYNARARQKGGAQDYQKAAWYQDQIVKETSNAAD